MGRPLDLMVSTVKITPSRTRKGKSFHMFDAAPDEEMATMLSFFALIEPSIKGQELSHLDMKAAGIRKISPEAWPKFDAVHVVHAEFFIIFAKYCQRPRHEAECNVCSKVRMPPALWEEFCSFDPFIPYPQPSQVSPGEWAPLAELEKMLVTSPKYLPKNTLKKEGRSGLSLEHARTYIECCKPGCAKPRVVYRQAAFTADEEEEWTVDVDGLHYVCGAHPLPANHRYRLRTRPSSQSEHTVDVLISN